MFAAYFSFSSQSWVEHLKGPIFLQPVFFNISNDMLGKI